MLGLKVAWEKAAAAKGGAKPTTDEVAKAFKGIEYDSPSGRVKMALGNGHQGIQDTAYGTYRFNKAEERAGNRRHRPLSGRVREPAGGHDGRGMDQGRHARRQVQLSNAMPDVRRRGPIRSPPFQLCNSERFPVLTAFAIFTDGLVYAAYLFVVAIGLTLIFGVMKILNVTHGSFYAFGAYGAATAVGRLFRPRAARCRRLPVHGRASRWRSG